MEPVNQEEKVKPISDESKHPTIGDLRRHVNELWRKIGKKVNRIQGASTGNPFVSTDQGVLTFSSIQGLIDLVGAWVHGSNLQHSLNAVTETDAKIYGPDKEPKGRLTLDQLRYPNGPHELINQLLEHVRDQFQKVLAERNKRNKRIQEAVSREIEGVKLSYEADVKKAKERGTVVPDTTNLEHQVKGLQDNANWEKSDMIDPINIRSIDEFLQKWLDEIVERKDILIDRANADGEAMIKGTGQVKGLHNHHNNRLNESKPLDIIKLEDSKKSATVGEIRQEIEGLTQKVQEAIQSLRIVSQTENGSGKPVDPDITDAGKNYQAIIENIGNIFLYIKVLSESSNLIFIARDPASNCLLSLFGAISLGFVPDEEEKAQPQVQGYTSSFEYKGRGGKGGKGGRGGKASRGFARNVSQNPVIEDASNGALTIESIDLANIVDLLLRYLDSVPKTFEKLSGNRQESINTKAQELYDTQVKAEAKGVKMDQCLTEAAKLVGYTVIKPSDLEIQKIREYLENIATKCRRVQDGVRKAFNATYSVNIPKPAEMVKPKTMYDYQ